MKRESLASIAFFCAFFTTTAAAQDDSLEFCKSMLNVGFVERSNFDSYAKQIQDEYDSYCRNSENSASSGGNASVGIKAFTFSGGRSIQNTSKDEFCKIGSEKIYSEVKTQSAQSNGRIVLEQANRCGEIRANSKTESLWAEIDVSERDDQFAVTMRYKPGETERHYKLVSIEGDSIECLQNGVDVRNSLIVKSSGSQAFTCTKPANSSISSHFNFRADDRNESTRSISIRATSRNVDSERQDAINREVARISTEMESRMQASLDEMKSSLQRVHVDIEELETRILQGGASSEATRTVVTENVRHRFSCPTGSYMQEIVGTWSRGGPHGILYQIKPMCRKLF